MRSLSIFLLLSVLVSDAGSVKSQVKPPVMSTKEKQILVDSICKALNRHYIYPGKAKAMSEAIKKNLKAGAYSTANDPHLLALQLDKDLQEVHRDWHLRVRYEPTLAMRLETPMTDEERKKEKENKAKIGAEQNFFFRKTEIFPGNIGYLRLDGFVDVTDDAKPTLEAACKFLSNCKALIIDMRYSGGGSPEMVLLTQSYFFNEKTRMNDIIDQKLDTIKRFTDPEKCALKLGMPLYILTSRSTGSGSEDFTYGLQQAERAVIVGDTTAGGAHPTGPVSVGQGFVVHIPLLRSYNIHTKTDWEGTGVRPNVAARPEEALEKARILIYNKFMTEAKDELEKQKMSWNIKSLENKTALNRQLRYADLKLSPAELLKFCGEYLPPAGSPLTVMSVVIKGENLCRHVSPGEDVRLVPVSNNKFIYDDDSGRDLQFIPGENGEAVDVVLSRPDGSFTLNRKKQ